MKFKLKKQASEADRAKLKRYSDFSANMLLARGIATEAEAENFLNPVYELADPFLLPDAHRAVDRIIGAIEKKEKIMIFSDYDADGIPGAALFADFLSQAGADFEVAIPNRGLDGFGLNEKVVREASEKDVKLLITIDCGINDPAEAVLTKTLGIDLIITDHHEPPEEGLPEAFAVVDPKTAGSKYPDKNLCGTGVIFRLVEAILKKNRFGIREGQEKWLLDLVAIATIADQVPLLGENRILATFGLKVLRKTRRAGLLELFGRLRIHPKNASEDDIAFSIAPRINASSRMGDPFLSYKLLRADDSAEAKELADELEQLNNKRKTEVALMIKEIKKRLAGDADNESVIVAGHSAWRPSLLGLAAGMIAEEVKVPVFLWGKDEEARIKGSFRSDGKIDVLSVVRKSETIKMFSDFGGHAMAGGFSVSDEQIHFVADSLRRAFDQSNIDRDGSLESKEGVLYADSKLCVEDVNDDLWRELERFAPFGLGNPKPVFLLDGVRVGKVKKFGKTGAHLSADLIGESGAVFPAVTFFSEGKIHFIEGEKVSVIGNLEKSYFNGSSVLRLRILGRGEQG